MKSFYKNINWIKNIYRIRGPAQTRFNYLRLDKNERVSNIKTSFLKNLLNKIRTEHLTAYPETEKLYDLISSKIKVNKRSIVLTAGSDAAIRTCFDLFVGPKDKIITISPTFAMVDIYAKLYRAKQIKIKYDSKLNLDFKKLLNSINRKIALVIIANPNSPTGTLLGKDEIVKVLKKALKKNTIVLIDEAYFGFSKESCLPLIKKFPNLIVTRTFSKSFGLAGCRVGYIVSNQNLADKLFRFKPMYEINSIAILIATEFLKKTMDKKYINQTKEGKNYLITHLEKMNFDYIDTAANFIHINFKNKRNTAEKTFFKNKILVKGGPGVKGYENFLRITLGPKNNMKKVVFVLKKIKKL